MKNGYMEAYDEAMRDIVDKPLKILELGIHRGGSLLLWRDYFQNAEISGIDLSPCLSLLNEDRIKCFCGNQTDTEFLSNVSDIAAPDGFDVIIDDCSHIGSLTSVSFWHLFDNHLKPSGIYVIEDWGTGYWSCWPDGQSFSVGPIPDLNTSPKSPWPTHSHGMVGFVKSLVDEQSAPDWQNDKISGASKSFSRFEKMTIRHGLVFVTKEK